MNDAHIYCTLEQIAQEFAHNIKMIQDYYETFGFDNYHFRLSLWDPENPDKYIDQPENWKTSQNHLRQILNDLGVKYEECVGEAAFYGPKVDIQFTTLLGREESMSTIQLDFAAKDRFGLTFMDDSGTENSEVFVIHRAPLSTHERFVAFLTENWAGNFPTWLSPIQVQLITISEKHNEYAATIEKQLKELGIRVKADYSDHTIGKKIRMHRKMRPAYMAIIGDDEVKNNTISIRARNGNQKNGLLVETFLDKIKSESDSRSKTLELA
jgi:threonyl-tRNA synthetase